MACNCGKGRAARAAAAGAPVGTYRVLVKGRKVYETTNQAAAATVAERFQDPVILAPGETA